MIFYSFFSYSISFIYKMYLIFLLFLQSNVHQIRVNFDVLFLTYLCVFFE